MGRVQDRVVSSPVEPAGSARRRATRSRPRAGSVVVADLDAAAAQAVADAIVENGGTAASVGVDVTDRAQVQAMIQHAVDTFGALNVIFNNAGMNRPRDFMEVDEENFESIVRVNTWGVIVCTQEAAKQMIAQGSGGQDHQHRVDREPAGILGLRPLLRREVRHARHHPGDRARPHRARDHRQRVRSRRRRHADVGRPQRGHPGDPRAARRSTTRCASSRPERSSGAPPRPPSWRRSSSTSPLRSPTT